MSWQELMTLGKEKYDAGKFKEARIALKDALAQASKNAASPFEIAEIKFELGKTCRVVTAFDESLTLLHEAASTFKNEGREAEQALALNFLGLLHQSLYQLDESQKVLDEALEIAERVHSGQHEDVGEILNSLGLLHWRRGDDAKSLEYCERALSIYSATIGEENDRYAETFDNMGVSYQRIGQLDKALAHHTRSIEIREKCLGPNHPHIGYGLINLGAVKAKLGDDKEYEQLAKRTIKVFEEGFGEDSPDTSLAINNLGTYYLEKMRLDEALEKFNQVLKVKEAVFGADHPQLRVTFHNLGIVHKFLGHEDESKKYYTKALVLLRKTVADEGGKNIDSLITLADSLQSNNEKEEAQKILEDALLKFEDGPEKNDSKAARVLEMLGAIHQMHSHETAKEFYFKLLKIQRKEFGAKHPNVSKTLRNLSNCFAMQGDATTSQVLLTQARSIEFQFGLDNPDEQAMSIFLNRSSSGEEDGASDFNRRMMITMLRMQGKDDEADEMEAEQLALRAAILGADSLEYAEELRNLAFTQMDNVKQLDLLEQVLKIQEANPAVAVDDLLWTLQSMVMPCLSTKKYDRAEQVLLKGLALEEERNGKDHWTLRGLLGQLVHNAEQQKNPEAVDSYKKRLDGLKQPTEQEEEEFNQRNNAMVQERLSRAMAGLGSMFQGLTDTLSNMGAINEEH